MDNLQSGFFNRSFWVWVVVSVFICSCKSVGNDIKVVKDSVVKIYSFDSEGQPLETSTGFFISDSIVLTHKSAVGDASILYGENDALGKFALARFDSARVGCGLQLFQAACKSASFLDVSMTGDLTLGVEVNVFGFPSQMPLSLSQGIVSTQRGGDGDVQLSVPTSSVSSGSPVLSKEGVLLGVARVPSGGQYQGVSTGVQCLSEYLNRAQLSPTSREYHLAVGGSSMGVEVVSVCQTASYTELSMRTMSLNLPYINTYYWYEKSHLMVDGSSEAYDLLDSDLPKDRSSAVRVGLGEELRFNARFERVPHFEGLQLVDDYDSWNVKEIVVGSDLNLGEVVSNRTMQAAAIELFENEGLVGSIIESVNWDQMANSDLERAMLIGVRHYLNGEMASAASTFNSIISVRPCVEAYSNLWRVHWEGEEEQDAQLALEAISRAVQLEPKSSDLLQYKLWSMEKVGQYDEELIVEAEKLIQLDPEELFKHVSHWARLQGLEALEAQSDPRYCESMKKVWYSYAEDWKKDWVEQAAWRCSW